MLTVKVELNSAITGETSEIAKFRIYNIGRAYKSATWGGTNYRTNTLSSADAKSIPYKDWGDKNTTGLVTDYPRNEHVLHLVYFALKAMGYGNGGEFDHTMTVNTGASYADSEPSPSANAHGGRSLRSVCMPRHDGDAGDIRHPSAPAEHEPREDVQMEPSSTLPGDHDDLARMSDRPASEAGEPHESEKLNAIFREAGREPTPSERAVERDGEGNGAVPEQPETPEGRQARIAQMAEKVTAIASDLRRGEALRVMWYTKTTPESVRGIQREPGVTTTVRYTESAQEVREVWISNNG